MITNGQYIRQQLISVGSRGTTITDLHKGRKSNPDVIYKKGTYANFVRLFRWFIDLKWVVQTGKKEPSKAKGDKHFLASSRIYYRITAEGKRHPDEDWKDIIGFVHPEWKGGLRAKPYRKPTGKLRGRPRAKPKEEVVKKSVIEKPAKEKKISKPKVVVELTQEDKDRVLMEFRQIMGREPTRMEIYELFSEELKLKRKRVEGEGG